MIYGSVCSGIEAATQAWHPLGWTPAFFSEIERFPAAVLAHHYGSNMPGKPLTANGVPNLGDMTKFKEWPDYAIDILVGGTPCQSFSVAGLRKGLADPRGNLMLTYLALLDRYRPRWCVWENVPGVLSSNRGRDFGSFLGGLGELGYGFAYRVLDAQYVRTCRHRGAVPQRRRRVFVVGYFGDWRRAAAVLFDRESLSGNPPPRRTAGKVAAPTLSSRTREGGGLGTDFDLDGGLIASTGDVAHYLNAGGMGRIDYESETMVAHALHGDGFDASEDGTGRGTQIVPVAYRTAGDGAVYEEGDVTAPLTTATDQNAQVIAFSANDHGGDASEQVSPTLRSGGFDASHANGGVMPAVCYGLSTQQEPKWAAGVSPTLAMPSKSGGGQVTAVAFDLNQITSKTNRSKPDPAVHHTLPASSCPPHLATQWAVRRMTATECHRLQGFPDGFCNIPWRGKDHAPDGPQYKALGNSMAVNCMTWLGKRIQTVEGMSNG